MTAMPGAGPRPAAIGRRFGAYLIDQLVLFAVLALVVALILALAPATGTSVLLLLVLYPLMGLGYGIFLWGWTANRGLTPGKRALRLRVVSAADGGPIGWGRAFLRQLVLGLVVGCTAGVGGIVLVVLAAQDPRRQGWHDKAAGSVVLDERGGTGPVPPAPGRPVERPSAGVVPVALPPSAPVRVTAAAPAAPVRAPVEAVPAGPPPVQHQSVPASVAPAPVATGLISAVPGVADDGPGSSAQPTAAPVAPPVVTSPLQDDEEDVGHTRLTPVRRPSSGAWRLDAGEEQVVEVSGAGLIGRAPEPRPHERIEHLIPVDDPQRSVSKTHLEFGVDDRGFWVRDRGSTNGSAVVTPGGARQACPPGVTVHVAAGSTVLVGDREVRVDRS